MSHTYSHPNKVVFFKSLILPSCADSDFYCRREYIPQAYSGDSQIPGVQA
jgi:hypothetical protein